MERSILIDEDGTVRFVYDDELAAAFDGEEARTVRASHVEPAGTISPGTQGWIADMRPSGGAVLTSNGADEYVESLPPFLDGRPFATRQAALDAERQWLRNERGL